MIYICIYQQLQKFILHFRIPATAPSVNIAPDNKNTVNISLLVQNDERTFPYIDPRPTLRQLWCRIPRAQPSAPLLSTDDADEDYVDDHTPSNLPAITDQVGHGLAKRKAKPKRLGHKLSKRAQHRLSKWKNEAKRVRWVSTYDDEDKEGEPKGEMGWLKSTMLAIKSFGDPRLLQR
jgi:hypothetical protein